MYVLLTAKAVAIWGIFIENGMLQMKVWVLKSLDWGEVGSYNKAQIWTIPGAMNK